MFEYIAFNDVLELLNIQETQIFSLLNDGLQPYDLLYKPVALPKPIKKRILQEQKDKEWNLFKAVILDDHHNPEYGKYLEEYDKLIEIGTNLRGKIESSSWDVFEMPPDFEDIKDGLLVLRSCYFKKSDIEELKSRLVIQPGHDSHDQPVFIHSLDYRSITVKGKKYFLTGQQAAIIKFLYEAYETKSPIVGEQTILVNIGTPQKRLRDAFGDRKTFKELIEKGERRGTFRLKID